MPRLSVQEDVGIERTTRHCSGSYRQAFIGCCRVSSSAQYNAQLHQFVISQIPELLPSPNGFESPLTDEDSQRIPKMRFLTSEFATIVEQLVSQNMKLSSLMPDLTHRVSRLYTPNEQPQQLSQHLSHRMRESQLIERALPLGILNMNNRRTTIIRC
jgi:hypothetical protein